MLLNKLRIIPIANVCHLKSINYYFLDLLFLYINCLKLSFPEIILMRCVHNAMFSLP